MRRLLFFAVISGLFSASAFSAPYLGKELEFHQPDGSPIAVRVWGDEFYIRAETLDGYSLVRDPVSGFICYAEVNNDGSDFISTGISYTGQTVEKLKYSGLWPAQGNGIKKGLRLKHQAVIEKADKNRRLLRSDQRGRILPPPDSKAFSAASAQADAPAPLIGQVVGLTLLIQFPDVPATIAQADISNYCNQVGYTGYGNNGSVRDYYYDVSNGNLTYTNYVTVYYTAQYNRAYYTDPGIPYGTRARELIQEALLWLDNPSGQNFNFGTITTDGGSYMLAINAFYAGPTVNNWAEGLWPHKSSMYGMFTSNEGVKSGVYQITNIGSSLVLGTFCHENGHMICGYPDLYDYGYESYGAGNYCLMAYGGSDYNPIPPNPYLRDIKGWESVTVFPHLSGVQYFLQSNSNTSYKYLNPDNSHEFFYIDSRTKTGRNTSLPDDGLVIWHIDENGSNNNEQMTPSQHYLVSVEQADGLFHLEYGNNVGSSGDLFHAGYKDIFNDTTNPSAKWWNGNNSNLVIRQISAVGSTMSFVYDDSTVPQPPVAQAGSASTQINTSVPITLVATDEGLPNPPGILTYIITSLPANGQLSDPGAGSVTAVPYTLAGHGNQVVYMPTTGFSGLDSFMFKANDGGTPPQGGDSNTATVSISVVDVIYLANMNTNPGWSATGQWQWGVPTGQGGTSYGNPDPTGGYTGSKVYGVNLNGDYSTTVGGPYYLTTQGINCSGFENIRLKFYRWLNSDYQPYVSASVEVSNNASTWTTVWENAGSEIADNSWQLLDYDISSVADGQPNVYVRWGYNVASSGAYAYSGWNIDDMEITGDLTSCTLTVNSSGASSVSISSSTGHDGTTNYTQTLTIGTSVTLTAPAVVGDTAFTGWTGDVTDSNQTISFSMNGHKTVTANFSQLPQYELTMDVSPSAGGTTTPSVGTTLVSQGIPNPIDAQANAGYVFNGWTALPAENVIFGNSNSPSTTAALSNNAAITANFNAKPVADINAAVNVLVITEANSVTLDASGSTDDGLPNPPGLMTYHWEKVSGPNTCNILDPDIAVTGVLFWGLGSYEFSVTVSDGQLQDVKSATVDVVVDVAYVAGDGDDNTGLGTIENPFATIKRGMDVVRDDGTVVVLSGTYYENINFGGRKIMVKSVNPDDPCVVADTVINAGGSGSVVTFNSGEDANSVLAGFTITGGNAELGGGIYIDVASPIIEKNVITGNSAGSEGGGIYCQAASAVIRYNKISSNYSGFFAGGVSFESSFALLQNNLIVRNNADFDPGVACIEGQPRIVNNTITGNVAVYDYDSSGLLIISSSLSPIISNNIIAFNEGAPGVVDFGGFDPSYFSYNDVYGHPNGNYLSTVLPAMDQTGVNGNISVNPLFADSNANDYHLLPESLLIDAGNPSSDCSSEPRPNGGRINLGAYGNTSEATCSLAGDITWDKKVDFKDFAKLAFYWLQNEPSVDIAPLVSGDNIIDVGDLMLLAEHWLDGI